MDCLIEWVSEWISGWLMVNHCSVSVIIFLPVSKDTPKDVYTLEPTKSEWTDYAAVQTYCGNLSGNELTRSSSGNTRSHSSQPNKGQAGNELSNIFPKSSHTRKKPPPYLLSCIVQQKQTKKPDIFDLFCVLIFLGKLILNKLKENGHYKGGLAGSRRSVQSYVLTYSALKRKNFGSSEVSVERTLTSSSAVLSAGYSRSQLQEKRGDSSCLRSPCADGESYEIDFYNVSTPRHST